MKKIKILSLCLLFVSQLMAQKYTLRDTLIADSLMRPFKFSSKKTLCWCGENNYFQNLNTAYTIYKEVLGEKSLKTNAYLHLVSSFSGFAGLQNYSKAALLGDSALKIQRTLVPKGDTTLVLFLSNLLLNKLIQNADKNEMRAILEEEKTIAFLDETPSRKKLRQTVYQDAKYWKMMTNEDLKGIPNNPEEDVYKINKDIYGAKAPQTANALMAWGVALKSKEPNSSKAKIKEALEIAESFKITHPNEYFTMHDQLLSFSISKGELDAEIKSTEYLIDYFKNQCGDKSCNIQLGFKKIALAGHYADANDIDKAFTLLTKLTEGNFPALIKLNAYESLARVYAKKEELGINLGIDSMRILDNLRYRLGKITYAADSLANQMKWGNSLRFNYLNEFGSLYNALKEPKQALYYLHKCRRIVEDTVTIFTFAQEDVGKSNVYLNLSKSYKLLGQLDSAIYFLEKHIDIDSKKDREKSLVEKKFSYFDSEFNLFSLYHSAQRVAEADNLWAKWTAPKGILIKFPCLKAGVSSAIFGKKERSLEDSHIILKRYNIDMETDTSLAFACEGVDNGTALSTGLMWQVMKKNDLALIAFQHALDLDKGKLVDIRKHSLNIIRAALANLYISQIYSDMSQNNKNERYLLDAINYANESHRLFEKLRTDLTAQPWRGSGMRKDAYEAIWSLAKYHLMLRNSEANGENRIEKGFHFSEKSKALSLLNVMLSKEAIEKNKDIPAELLKESGLCQDNVRVLEITIANLNNDTNLPEVEKSEKIEKYSVELSKWNKRQEQNNSKLKPFIKVDIDKGLVDINTVPKSILSKDEALIQYLRYANSLYAIVIKKDAKGRDTVWATAVDSIKDFLGLMTRYTEGVSNQKSKPNTIKQLSDSLYQCLIKPLDPSLLPKNLIIVPHRTMSLIPFEALWDNNRKEYLIEKHAIRYAYSATTLLKMQQTVVNTKGLIGFAPIAANVGSDNIANREPFNTTLNGAKQEVDTISALANGKSYFLKDATKERFKAEAPQYAYIHIASHAASDANPRIAFFKGNHLNWNTDNTLNVRELYSMKLNAELVTLSACETFGKNANSDEAEGIMGLARGFSQTGVKSLVATLWVTKDDKTQALMTDFYKNLKAGMTKSNALREAKLKMIMDDKDPYLWAAPVLIGASNAVSF